MRIRPVLTVPAAAAAAALLLAVPRTSSAAARPAQCAEKAVVVRAHRSADPTVVRISVTNRSSLTCTVDRIPTVTFGDLDGAALPVPAGRSGPYPLGAGRTAYAAVRTIADPADPETRRVDSISVSADPSRFGRSFTARELGAGDAVLVWEPVTTWWKSSRAAADRALG
ncbi:DUF4232 domain-containing protein [Streptomyces sp. NBC_01136]|uniref:DUF4232 domain-containing protein n=1 Tax=unclassified Streptomyces TaxID=2593676 RepID=UPI0032482632|nr:DUF4232 domain-containing protein [Streptomyces sp. NBC_01136]